MDYISKIKRGFAPTLFVSLVAMSAQATTLPSFENQVAQYLSETGAAVVERAFEVEHGGALGITRRVVQVSAESFPVFQRLFVNRSILYLFHEPFQRVIGAGYNGMRGAMGRLESPFDFTFSGAMIIPIVLSSDEVERVEAYFQLAAAVPRSRDVASFPWLLKNASNVSYMPVGDQNSFSEWFARMPIGTEVDQSRTLPDYSVDSYSDSVRTLLRQVWTAPHSHLSLQQTLGLRPFRANRNLDTPGLIASALLAVSPAERIPVVFRYVDDHRVALPADFNNWFDVNFNPNQLQSFKERKK